MYTEEYEKRGFPFRDFLLKLILVIVFVFLLCFLLPKFITPSINSNSKNVNGKGCTTQKCNTSGINALTSQIFSDNLERMKKAAINYYTDERLPKEVGQSDTMTLSDMIGKKLIVALIDKNNKAVDVEKSYVKITKMDDEYLLKVNIKDSEKEDYILVHLGCYTYCASGVCEKQGVSTPVKGAKNDTYVPIKGAKQQGIYYVPKETTKVIEKTICGYRNGNYYDKKGYVVSKEEYKKQCGVPEDKHICVKYNGKYYNKDGKEVNEDEYIKSCSEEKHYCVEFNGNFYNKEGNVVSKTDYEISCGIVKKHTCTKLDGKYYDKEGNVVTEEVYKTSCGIEDKHYCTKYNDKYYGSTGKVVSYEEYKKQCETKKEYEYEYKKIVPTKFSSWTPWSAWSKTDCSTQEINCNDADPTCLKKLQRYNRKEQIGTYEKTYAKTRDVVKQTSSYTEKACSKYNYVVINHKIYATTTTTKYTQTNVITSTTRTTTGGWTYVGRQLFTNPPRDTNTRHYKFVGADYSYCSDTCTTLPNYWYDIYEYTGGLTTVDTTTTPGNINEIKTSSTSVKIETETKASCGEYVTKTIPVYSTITVTEKARRTEPLYGDVCYQSTKTRYIISSEHETRTWDVYNKKSLLDNGWAYTGNKRIKK